MYKRQLQTILEAGTALLIVEQQVGHALELCDRVAIMDHGKIVAMDRPAELVSDLINRGFRKERIETQANLEDVFLDITGRALQN